MSRRARSDLAPAPAIVSMRYEPIAAQSRGDAEAALRRDDPTELLRVPLAASLHTDDRQWAEQLCARLAMHADPYVRGNAILGFGHLARRFGMVDWQLVQPLLQRALTDPHPHVRGQAASAADDLRDFAGQALPNDSE